MKAHSLIDPVFKLVNIGGVLVIGDFSLESSVANGRVCVVVPGMGVRALSVSDNKVTQIVHIDAKGCSHVTVP